MVDAYRGKEPYIFVSYSHRDSNEVHKIIEKMYSDGYRVWFDNGIDPGTEWDENIAKHIKECAYFIAFLSQNYLDSDNCKDELNYARDKSKKRLLVYLEDVTLPDGMAMRLNRLQYVSKYSYTDEKKFYEKLYSADGIDELKSASAKKKIVSAVNSYEGNEEDSLFDQAVVLVIGEGKASTSLLQRRLSIGYGRAADMLDRMEELGYVGKADGAKPRSILVTLADIRQKKQKEQKELKEIDPLMEAAVKLAIENQKISTSLIQRRLSIGYGRAAKLIDQMEELGYIGEADGTNPRRVLITSNDEGNV